MKWEFKLMQGRPSIRMKPVRRQCAVYFPAGFLPVLLSVICFNFCTSGAALADEAELWRDLRAGNHFVLLRHAIAPGMGDPAHFKLGECTTQRNLSDEGRKQAVEIGKRFRANGIEKAKVFASQWCRCFETATLLRLGPVRELPVLNSFFRHYQREESQTRMLKDWLVEQEFKLPLVLVTHQVNITALTQFYPASGELVVVGKTKDGEFTVAGSIQTDPL